MQKGSSPSLVRRLFRFLWLEKKDIKTVVLYGVGVSVLNLILPLGAQAIFTNLAYGTLLQPIVIVTLLIFVVLGASGILQSFQVYLVEMIQRRIFSRITFSIANYIPKTKGDAFEKINGMELMNRFFEVMHVQKMQSLILMDGLGIVLQIFFGLLLLALYHPYLLLFDLLFLSTLGFVVFVMGQGGIATSLDESKEKYRVASWLEEITRHKKLLSGFRGSDFTMRRVDELISGYLGKRQSHFRILFRQYIGTFIIYVIASVGLLLLGSWLVTIGELTVGQLVAAEIILSGIVASLVKFGKYVESGYDLIASYEKLEAIFDLPYDSSDQKIFLKDAPVSELKMQGLGYKHDDSSDAIGPIDLNLSEGDRLVIYGRSGSGKSTLANIICGFKAHHNGSYMINGISINDLCRRELYNKFFLLDRPALFAGTLLENITFERGAENNERLVQILESFPFSKDIFSLPDGLATTVHGHVGEFSDRLVTLISIMRAVYRSPDCLVVDQTLDKLDENFRQALVKYLDKVCPDMILVFLTSDEDVAKLFPNHIDLEDLC